MKKTIRLNLEYLDLKNKKISISEELNLRKDILRKAIKEFKNDIKDLFASSEIKIIKECFSRSEIIVEYQNDKTYDRLLKSDIVQVIDSQIYEGDE